MPGLVDGRHLQRLQLRFNRLLLLADFRRAAAKLLQRDQALLIGSQQAFHALRQARLIST
jgi:hypothetical protein